jgi:hypothetical protein
MSEEKLPPLPTRALRQVWRASGTEAKSDPNSVFSRDVKIAIREVREELKGVRESTRLVSGFLPLLSTATECAERAKLLREISDAAGIARHCIEKIERSCALPLIGTVYERKPK